MKKSRRFGLAVRVEYRTDEGNPGYLSDTFRSSFDWQNRELQFAAVPVKIRKDSNYKLINPVKIEVFAEYSQNEGSAEFTNLTFNICDFEYTEFNKDKTVKLFRNPNRETHYEYNEKQLPVKVVEINRDGKQYESKLDYNSKDLLVRIEAADGTVTENIYDANSNLNRSVSYHKDEPASRFYSDKTHDSNGRLTAEYDARGGVDGDDISTKYDYYTASGLAKSAIDANGNKTVFGYGIRRQRKILPKKVKTVKRKKTALTKA